MTNQSDSVVIEATTKTMNIVIINMERCGFFWFYWAQDFVVAAALDSEPVQDFSGGQGALILFDYRLIHKILRALWF
jgi:hypothetical protein